MMQNNRLSKQKRIQTQTIFTAGVVIAMLLASVSASAVSSDDFEFHGYLRSGARANSGTEIDCPKNVGPAAGINEFRLGNECGTYGELSFVANHLGKAETSDPFFKTIVTLAINSPGVTLGEAANVNIVEAYFTAGKLGALPLTYWVGKRFYRDASVHFNDEFYFANMSGNGAGVAKLVMPKGNISFAYFLEQTNPSQLPSGQSYYKGHYLDLRWFDIALAPSNSLDIWLIGGKTSEATLASAAPGGTTTYLATSGFAAGAKHIFDFGRGKNQISLQYGRGLLQGLKLENTADVEGASEDASTRVRLVEHLSLEAGQGFSVEFAARAETFAGKTDATSGKWFSLGARPILSLSRHFAVATEFGCSRVTLDSKNEASDLCRVTLAPELRPNSKYLTRPVLRAFATTSFKQGSAFGFQGESWF